MNQTSLFFLFYCVVDGFFLCGLGLPGVFFRVLELPLVMLLSLDVAPSESNPPSFFVMLLMVFFLVAMNFLVFFSCS